MADDADGGADADDADEGDGADDADDGAEHDDDLLLRVMQRLQVVEYLNLYKM